MDNKNILRLLTVSVILLLIIVGVLVFKDLSQNRNPLSSSQNEQDTNPNSQNLKTITITEKDKIPATVTGIVESIDSDRIIIKQFASKDLNYVFNKSDFNKIVTLKPNPEFNKEKAEAKANELKKNPKNTQNTDLNKKPETPIDTTLSPYKEEDMNWDNITNQAQVNIQTDEKGNRKLYIFPKEVNIAPPTEESQ